MSYMKKIPLHSLKIFYSGAYYAAFVFIKNLKILLTKSFQTSKNNEKLRIFIPRREIELLVLHYINVKHILIFYFQAT